MLTTEVEEPKEDDPSSDRCVPNAENVISGWEVIRARLLHATVPLLQLFNKMEGVAMALASHVYEFEDVNTYVPHIHHQSMNEKEEAARTAQHTYEINMKLGSKALGLKRGKAEDLPSYPFNDRQKVDKVIKEAVFVGSAAVSTKAAESARSLPSSESVG